MKKGHTLEEKQNHASLLDFVEFCMKLKISMISSFIFISVIFKYVSLTETECHTISRNYRIIRSEK